MTDRAPFDPNDPFNILADTFRQEVASIALAATSVPGFAQLPHDKQIECFLSGVLTATVGVAFTYIHEDARSRSEMVKYIVELLPFVREQAEGIIEDGKRVALSHFEGTKQ